MHYEKGVSRLSPEKSAGAIVRVAAYCRISANIKETIPSLENQVHHYIRHIKNNPKYKLIGVYYDRGVSGLTKEKRPGFMRMLRHCEEHKIDLILTKSVSRFSRNSKDLLEVVQHLKKLGVAILFERENINTLHLKNEFFLTTMAAIAQEDIRTISEVTKWGVEKRYQKGIPTFKRLFGYNVQHNDRDVNVTINEEEAAIVREIFNLFIGGMKRSEIARQLIERRVKTIQGRELWTSQDIGRLIKNESYTGDKLTNHIVHDLLTGSYKRNNGQRQRYLIKNCFPPIINKETFQKAQAILEKSKPNNKPAQRSKELPLSKRINCGLCGSIYHRQISKKDPAWRCKQRRGGTALCRSKITSEKNIAEMMKKALDMRYEFSKPSVLKNMLIDIKRMNQNDHFEYQRLNFLNQIEMAREAENKAADHEIKAAKQKREQVEQEFLIFEELATKLEQDRKYRNQAIEWLTGARKIENISGELTIEYMRAWIISITIFSPEAFIVRWFDNSETKVGDCGIPAKPIEKKPTLHPVPQKVSPEVEFKTEVTAVKQYNPKEVVTIEPNPFVTVSRNVKKQYELYTKNFNQLPKTTRKIRTAAYCRISTDVPHQLGSLETQMAYYTYYILKNPAYEFAGLYSDQGLSGTKTQNRKEFLRLMEDCRAGRIDRIITKSISRFSRNTVDTLEYVRMLKSLPNPVSIFFEREGIDTLDEDSEVMLTVYSGLAQEETRSLSEGVSWGKRRLAERGIYHPSAKYYGYDIKDGEWIIKPNEADVIRRIYHDYLAGKSMNQITKELSKEGFKTAKGKDTWGRTTVLGILRNRVYEGSLLYQKTYTIDTLKRKNAINRGELPQVLMEEHHPPIVSPEVWEAVQTEMARRNKNCGRNNKNWRPHTRQEFSKILFCSQCGSLIEHWVKKGIHYWRCKTALGKDFSKDCSARSLREESMEHAFMVMLQEMKQDGRFTTEVKQVIEKMMPSEGEQNKVEKIKEEMQTLYQELYQAVDADTKKDGQNPQKITQLTDRIINLRNQIKETEDKQVKAEKMREDLDWLINELEGIQEFNLEKERIEFRADIFSRIVEKGTVFPDKIIYDLRLGIQWTATGNDIKAWRLKMKRSAGSRKM